MWPYFLLFTRSPKFGWHWTKLSKLAWEPVHLHGNSLSEHYKPHHYSHPITNRFLHTMYTNDCHTQQTSAILLYNFSMENIESSFLYNNCFKSLLGTKNVKSSTPQFTEYNWCVPKLCTSYLNELLSCYIRKQLTDGTFLQSNTGKHALKMLHKFLPLSQ